MSKTKENLYEDIRKFRKKEIINQNFRKRN